MNSAYWDSGAVAARQLANTLILCDSEWVWSSGLPEWTILIHIDIGATLNLLQCLRVLFVDVQLYRITVQRDITGTAGFVAIVSL